MQDRTYIAIDLKSFFASVECAERGLDPLTTNLVVADESRTSKTICLAITPSLKALGLPGRARLFEVEQKVKGANAERRRKAPGQTFTGKSCHAPELAEHPELAISYIVAPPRMAYYMDYSARIYDIYLRYVAPEDMHVYSIDEVFLDVTTYLKNYHMSAHDLTMKIIHEVLRETNITATAGIGTNMYLCKIAMDIVAKRMPADKDGVRIAELDEMSYRKLLWNHVPLRDFWRIGPGYERKLQKNGLYTMGDIARCSLGKPGEHYNEDLLYELFGVNAELLIDHAWGYEPTTIADIRAYRPQNNSLSSGQVLHEPYTAEKAKLIVKEMTDLLALDLVDKRVVTDQIVLTVGYDIENLTDPERRSRYKGEIIRDGYGRQVPKYAHGTENLPFQTSSSKMILEAVGRLFDRIINPDLLVRRINVVANHVVYEDQVKPAAEFEQMDLFTDYDERERQEQAQKKALKRERNMQEAVLELRKKYGKNAVLKGMNLEEGGTTIQRNSQIGGHKA